MENSLPCGIYLASSRSLAFSWRDAQKEKSTKNETPRARDTYKPTNGDNTVKFFMDHNIRDHGERGAAVIRAQDDENEGWNGAIE